MLANALSGLKVLDFTQVAAGPTCTMMLADMGAEVVKIEPPTGDLGRQLEPVIHGESAGFMALNRNKRSVVLDLKSPAGLASAQALAEKADVLVESFRPGIMERLGLGSQTLRQRNPRLVFCSISAYGQTSPSRGLPGVDGVLQAVSGLMSVTGSPNAAPCKMQTPVVDMTTGYLAAVSILGALFSRQRTGDGQVLDISMFNSAIALQQIALGAFLADGRVPGPSGSAAPYSAPNEALRCADGWIMLAAYHPGRWEALCRVIGAPELAIDPRFSDNAGRVAHRVELIGELEARLLVHPRSHWLEAFTQADIICGPIQDYAEVISSTLMERQALVESIDHPTLGEVRMPRSVLAALGEIPRMHRPPPTLGQHTREVLEGLERKGNDAEV